MRFSMALSEDNQIFCQEILKKFLHQSNTIETVLLASPDGILLAGLGLEEELDVMAAMSASLLSIADALSVRTHDGVSNKVVCESNESSLVCLHAGNLILTVIGTKDANMGLVLSTSKMVAAEIAEVAAASTSEEISL